MNYSTKTIKEFAGEKENRYENYTTKTACFQTKG
jgi:hypothetical protein